MSDTWKDLTKTVLLGTDRQPPSPAGPGLLGEMLQGMGDLPPEQHLYGAAALVNQYERAGATAAVLPGDFAFPAAAPEHLPAIGAHAAELLREAVAAKDIMLVGECLEGIARKGLRVPFDSLPALLNLARGSVDLRAPLLPVLGARGGWLAEQNSEWNSLRGGEITDEATWQTGSPQARTSFLRAVRKADPGQARKLAEDVWKQEKAALRADFLETFSVNLSPKDEPFLERCLDDRSDEVRCTAERLLSRLPGSAYVARMAQRALPLVSLQKSPAGDEVHVRPRVEIDESLLRDGIPRQEKDKSPDAPAYQRSVVAFIIARVPPSTLANHLALPTDRFVELSRELPTGIFDALVEAALQFREMDFVRAWLAALDPPRFDMGFSRVTGICEPAVSEKILRAYIAGNWDRLYNPAHYIPAVGKMSKELQASFYPFIVDRLLKTLRNQNNRTWDSYLHFETVFRHADPGLYPTVRDLILASDLNETTDRLIEKLHLLKQRHDIQREFAP